MIRFFLKAVLLFPMALCAASPLNDPVAGAKLAADLRNAPPESDARLEGSLKTRSRDGRTVSTPLLSVLKRGPQSWEAAYVVLSSNATEILQVIHAQGQPNQYRHGRAAAASVPLMADGCPVRPWGCPTRARG